MVMDSIDTEASVPADSSHPTASTCCVYTSVDVQSSNNNEHARVDVPVQNPHSPVTPEHTDSVAPPICTPSPSTPAGINSNLDCALTDANTGVLEHFSPVTPDGQAAGPSPSSLSSSLKQGAPGCSLAALLLAATELPPESLRQTMPQAAINTRALRPERADVPRRPPPLVVPSNPSNPSPVPSPLQPSPNRLKLPGSNPGRSSPRRALPPGAGYVQPPDDFSLDKHLGLVVSSLFGEDSDDEVEAQLQSAT